MLTSELLAIRHCCFHILILLKASFRWAETKTIHISLQENTSSLLIREQLELFSAVALSQMHQYIDLSQTRPYVHRTLDESQNTKAILAGVLISDQSYAALQCEASWKCSLSVTESGVWLHPLKSQERGKVGGKESLLYFGGRQLEGQRVGQPPTDNQWVRAFREEFQGCAGRGRGYVQSRTVSSDGHLEIGPAVVSSASS